MDSSYNDTSDKSGPVINEDMLKDLNDINELNKAIKRANLIDDYDDIDMLKNRQMPPGPGPSNPGAINPNPMNYDFMENIPGNPGYMMDNYNNGSLERNYNSSNRSQNGRRNKRYVEAGPIDDLDDYIDVNNLRNGNGMGKRNPPINKNPILAYSNGNILRKNEPMNIKFRLNKNLKNDEIIKCEFYIKLKSFFCNFIYFLNKI